MTEKKKAKAPRSDAHTPTYSTRLPDDGTGTTGPRSGAMILTDEATANPFAPLRDAMALLEKSRKSFASKDVARAREIMEAFLARVVPPLPPIEIPDHVTIRIDGALGLELGNRGAVNSTTIKRELGRYYAVLREELAAIVTHTWTSEHALAFCRYARGRDPELAPGDFLANLVRAWEPDARNASPRPNISTELIERLGDLSPGGLAAMLDAADCFWRVHPTYEEDEIRALHRVGLLPPSRFSYGPGPEIVSKITR